MISFPNCKINLGLNIVAKRSDGYHTINSLFYPVPFHDILEMIPASTFSFSCSGLPINGEEKNNLVVKAYVLLKENFDLPPVAIHLYKNIPMGAGLGGGSSDGAFALKMINELFELQLSESELHKFAVQLGADCPFFIQNTPQLVKGIGDELTPNKLSLDGNKLLLVNDGTHIGTAEAYGGAVPKTPTLLIEDIIQSPMKEWKNTLLNDFELTVFDKYPALKRSKDELYKAGAKYAAMTGSGSTLFGIFDATAEVANQFDLKQGFIKEIILK